LLGVGRDEGEQVEAIGMSLSMNFEGSREVNGIVTT